MMYENYSLWDRLKEKTKPIIIYGTGNGADKIFDILDSYGIKPDGVFASDGFVRNRCFRGYKVKSYEDVISEFGDHITVLLAFGSSLPDVCDYIEKLDAKHELIIPDVPLYGGKLFDYRYFTENEERLKKAYSLLSDEMSKKVFTDSVNFRLTGKLMYLSTTEPTETTLSELFRDVKIDTVIDGGAFRGDSTEVFSSVLNPKKIYAVEADGRTYVKLCGYSEREKRTKVIPINAALSDTDGILAYNASGSRGSGEYGRNKRARITEINERRIDSIVGNDTIDFIKLDVEGDEMKSLSGAEDCIRRCEPSLAVSLYHRTDDLFELTEYIHGLLPKHKLYLRRVPCIPLWDLTLYAIKA